MRWTIATCLFLCAASSAAQEIKGIHLENDQGERVQIATLQLDAGGSYSITMTQGAFADHFLSMRPFRCVEGPKTHLCHLPYPYEIKRDISTDLTDLEYDLLFIWKGATEYGIDMWNGMYWQIADEGGTLVGTLHEMDMGGLAVPPPPGELRPIREVDLEPADPDGHWLPRLVIE